MYRRLRTLHRWVGLLASLFLLVISAAGFLLATKSRFGWVRPPEADGSEIQHLSEVVTPHVAAEAAFEVGLPVLQHKDHIDRIDYRPGSNVFKVVSKEGYKEVQVDGKTGKVLQVADRVDQLSEDIHDLSYFSPTLHEFALPVVAIFLFTLASTGVFIFATPIARRMRFRSGLRRDSPEGIE